MHMRLGVAATLAIGWVLGSGSGTSSALVANEVLSTHIKEADGTSGQNANAGSGIKTNHIQNSAVTSAKIKDGNVLSADLANRSVTAAKVGFYRRVIVVDANGGGDFLSPVAAMSSIGGASGANPHLVKIMPGVYDVGQSPVQMKPYVDIEGSGVGVTRITGAAPGGVVVGAGNAEIRFLTIENTSTDVAWNLAFYAPYSTDPSLLHVTAIAAGGQSGYKIGVYCDTSSSPRLTHVKARGLMGTQTAGVYSLDAAPVLTDVEARGDSGIDFNQGVYLYGGNAELRRVSATASGGGGQSTNVGIAIVTSSPVIVDTTSLAHAHSSGNVGIRIEGESRPELTNVSARGLGGTAIGLQTLELAAGQPAGGYAVVADRCTFEGATNSVHNDQEYEVTIGAGKLLGGPVDNSAGGTLRCLASYALAANLTSACAP